CDLSGPITYRTRIAISHMESGNKPSQLEVMTQTPKTHPPYDRLKARTLFGSFDPRQSILRLKR
ncbi:hypothetical protein VEx25_A0038, partial [Vibrio antiquarius]